jgi:hypothetical protein
MKRKILISILGLLILSQIPFAYRRYRLRRLQHSIQQLALQRSPAAESEFIDYQGVIHVHSFLGGHSTGSFDELISAARENHLDFVIMTEHPQADFDTAAMTLDGLHAGVLFVNGNELATADGDRLLLIPGPANAAAKSSQTTQQIITEQKGNGGLTFAAYPSESQNWQSTSVDGIEVYNLFTNARHINSVVMFFDGLWAYRSYGDLLFANFFRRPTENLRRWDDVSSPDRKLVAIAGNDAHSNVGLSLNDSSGKQLLGVKLDPYRRSFRVVRTHVLIRKDSVLSRETLLAALAAGHCYVSFDLFGDPNGFDFRVSNSDQIMGDEVTAGSQLRFQVKAPLPARFVLIRNGSLIDQKSGLTAEFIVDGPGKYRIEGYLDSLPSPVTGQPWIMSNPIYAR